MEVSSHALALHRVDGTRFDAAVFTNIGRDHLDLHGTDEEYFRAKARLFTAQFTELAVINVDDAHGRLLADTLDADPGPPRVVPYTIDELADLEIDARRHRYRFRGHRIEVPLGGAFNVPNSLAAVVTARELGIAEDVIAEGLAAMPAVPGRFEIVEPEPPAPFTVVVDYAHTAESLTKVLDELEPGPGGGRIAVFGSAGERDLQKRPAMGRVAGERCRLVVVTDEDPRGEDRMAILEQIAAGAEAAGRRRDDDLLIVADRAEAIAEALGRARPGDVVLLAGKGHERTIEMADGDRPWDEMATAEEALAALGYR